MARLQKIKMFALNRLPPIGIKLNLSVPRNSIFQAISIEDEIVYLYYEVSDSRSEYPASEIQDEIFMRLDIGLPIPIGACLIFLGNVKWESNKFNFRKDWKGFEEELLILYKIF